MVRIHLAITTNEQLAVVRKEKYPYTLFSYYYLKTGRVHAFPKPKGEKIIIDSGAHSIQQGVAKGDWDSFFKSYFSFLLQNKKRIDYAVELDIEEIVGMKKVEEWRKTLIENLPFPIITVWHKKRGWDYWERMCKEYEYVGFSGFLKPGIPEIPEKYLLKFFKVADKFGAKVHGFGYTHLNSLLITKFFSVDSSSWTLFTRYPSKPTFYSFKYKSPPNYSFKNKLPRQKKLAMGVKYYKKVLERVDETWKSKR